MTRLLTRCFLFSLTVFLFGLAACRKDKPTIINGTVVDKVTGEPVDSAHIYIGIKYSDNPNELGFDDSYSDQNGKFSFSQKNEIHFSDISKVGYLPKDAGFPSILQGEENNVMVQIIPKNGILNLTLNNAKPQTDTLFFSIYSSLQESEYPISHGVIVNSDFVISGLSLQTHIIHLAAEETIEFYWGEEARASSQINLYPYHDSVYVFPNDTTYFSISF